MTAETIAQRRLLRLSPGATLLFAIAAAAGVGATYLFVSLSAAIAGLFAALTIGLAAASALQRVWWALAASLVIGPAAGAAAWSVAASIEQARSIGRTEPAAAAFYGAVFRPDDPDFDDFNTWRSWNYGDPREALWIARLECERLADACSIDAAFARFLDAPTPRAFAVSADNRAFGSSVGAADFEAAQRGALAACAEAGGGTCFLIHAEP